MPNTTRKSDSLDTPNKVITWENKPGIELNSAKIAEVMTPVPITIDEDADLITARRVLRDNKIRHLPVTHGGRCTGILSERDTRLVSLLPEIAKMAVADIMSRNPLSVPETTPVLEAISKMAAKKFGCLIVKGPTGEISGIFTSQDALRLLLSSRKDSITTPSWGNDMNLDDEDDCLD